MASGAAVAEKVSHFCHAGHSWHMLVCLLDHLIGHLKVIQWREKKILKTSSLLKSRPIFFLLCTGFLSENAARALGCKIG